MYNNTQIVYAYGLISHVDKQMPWGTSRDHFKLGDKLDRDQMVNTWWAKVNNCEFIKEIEVINSISDKEYIEISKYKVGKYFEIMIILENYSKWLDKNPCPVRLLFIGKGKYNHRTELLVLKKSQLIMASGSQLPSDLLKQYKSEFDDAYEFKEFCDQWNIERECTGLYIVLV